MHGQGALGLGNLAFLVKIRGFWSRLKILGQDLNQDTFQHFKIFTKISMITLCKWKLLPRAMAPSTSSTNKADGFRGVSHFARHLDTLLSLRPNVFANHLSRKLQANTIQSHLQKPNAESSHPGLAGACKIQLVLFQILVLLESDPLHG